MELRFPVGLVPAVIPVFGGLLPKANRILAKKENATEAERVGMALEIISYMRRRFRTTTYVSGLHNLPEEGGCVLYANHQGRYDALGIYEALKEDMTVLWKAGQMTQVMTKQVAGLMRAVSIELTDPRDVVRAIRECETRVNNGQKVLIFPEGYYDTNHNTLQEFKPGCFQVSLRTKTPIVPVVLYDSYRSMNGNRIFGTVETRIVFLPQIPYEEYGTLRKAEVAELVKSRIAEGLANMEGDWRAQAELVLERRKPRASK